MHTKHIIIYRLLYIIKYFHKYVYYVCICLYVCFILKYYTDTNFYISILHYLYLTGNSVLPYTIISCRLIGTEIIIIDIRGV